MPELKDTPSGQNPKLTAEALRQQTRVGPKDETGNPITLFGEKFKRLTLEWQNKPEPPKNSPQHNEWDFWQTAKLTLENSNPKVTELAVNWDADKELTLGQLSELRSKIWEMVKGNDVSKNLKMQSQLRAKAFQALSRIKMVKALVSRHNREDKDPNLSEYVENLRQAEEFLEKDLLHKEAPDPNTPQEDYQTRLRKVIEEKQTTRSSHNTPLKRLKLLHALSKAVEKQQISRLSDEIVTDTIRLALAKNLLELKNAITAEQGVDWKDLKRQIDALPKNQEGAEKLLSLLSPITRHIVKHYKHDHASLMGQALVHNQAVCAGKEMMFGAILKEILEIQDAKYAIIEILNNNNLTGRHATTQIKWGDFLIEVDLNFNAKSQFQQQNNCLVNILKDEGVVTGYPGKDEILNLSDSQWIIQEGKYHRYTLVKGQFPHKLVSQEDFPDDYIDKNNYASYLFSAVHFDTLENDEQRKEALQKAAKLYEEAIELAPNNPDYKYYYTLIIIQILKYNFKIKIKDLLKKISKHRSSF